MALVTIRKTKPQSPGQRWKTTGLSCKTVNKTPKIFTRNKLKNAGRNDSGHVVVRTKGKALGRKRNTGLCTRVKLKRVILSQKKIYNALSNKPLILFATDKKELFILPATSTNPPGTLYYADKSPKQPYERGFIGLPILLTLFPYYFLFCNIAHQQQTKYTYTCSSGSSSIKIRAQKREKMLKIKLPSCLFKLFKPSNTAIAGKNKQMWHHKTVIGKAGLNRTKGIKQTVRGIAMNSVDHPNGGKANSAQPEKSPWGRIAKNTK